MSEEVQRFVFLNPIGILEGILIFLLFLIVFYGALRATRRLRSLKKSIVLISLRSASFLLIVFILLNPALRVENYKEEKPHLAVLVDHSWSMNLSGDEKGTTRIQTVRDFLKNYKTFFSEIEKKFILSYYVFDKSLRPASADFINTKGPEGKGTNIGEAIRELEKNYNPGELDSIILFSDGADNGRAHKDADEFLKGLKFHINAIAPLGNKIDDIWIDSVEASEVAFVRYPISIDVVIKSVGFRASNIPVTLKEGGDIVSTQKISIDSTEDKKVEFVLRPTSVGRKIYTVSIPVLAGEIIGENNQKSFVIDVIIDRIRVLHIAGSPSWDVRFLRQALKRNPNIDLVAFFILREASDLVFASQNELSLIPFPVDEIFGDELETFDVVIFQNFDFRPYGIYGYHLGRLRDYVMEGGAFLAIGGENSFDSGSYGRTPISEILPVELNPIPRSIEETLSTEKFQAKLTPIGARHPVMRMIPNQEENENYWKKMPELEGFNKVEGLKPETLPLLVTPQGEPILVLSQFGSGKAASFLSDSSWKWSFIRAGEGEIAPYYEKFWNRLLLWLTNDPELKDIRVKTDKASYSLGENPKLDLWITSGNEGRKIESSVVLPSGAQIELNLEKSSDGFSAEMEAKEYGVYKVKVSAGVVPRLPSPLITTPDPEDSDTKSDGDTDETVFLVEPPENEIKGPTADEDLLKTLADKTGGRFITVKDNPEKLGIDFSPKRTITGYKTIQIWDKPWFFIGLIILLSSEWILGRRWGLR